MWRAFATESVKYRSMSRQAKLEKTSEKVIECGRNIKNLYKLVSKLMSTEKENPMPTDTDNLADNFPGYFWIKSLKYEMILQKWKYSNQQTVLQVKN